MGGLAEANALRRRRRAVIESFGPPLPNDAPRMEPVERAHGFRAVACR